MAFKKSSLMKRSCFSDIALKVSRNIPILMSRNINVRGRRDPVLEAQVSYLPYKGNTRLTASLLLDKYAWSNKYVLCFFQSQ
jgi:hypothetical protein